MQIDLAKQPYFSTIITNTFIQESDHKKITGQKCKQQAYPAGNGFEHKA